jgi:hypothetical protein
MFSFLKRKEATALPSVPGHTPQPVRALPDDVSSLLRRRDQFNDEELRINLLDEPKALARLASDPIWGRLGLVTLDDAGDSNPYVLITRGVCAGMVAHFSHDPEPQVEFASLQEFEYHLCDLRRRRVAIDAEDRVPPAHPDQAALSGALLELACADDDADAAWLICFYADLLHDDQHGVLKVLATHRDFFVREAAAQTLGRADVPHRRALLEQLAVDGHGQVAAAARRSIGLKR